MRKGGGSNGSVMSMSDPIRAGGIGRWNAANCEMEREGRFSLGCHINLKQLKGEAL